MSYFEEAINNVSDNSVSGIHTCIPAKVVSYNQEANTCNVQPLYQYANGQTYPMLLNVPILKRRIIEKHYRNFPNTGLTVTAVDVEGVANHSHGFMNGTSGTVGTTDGAGAHTHAASVTLNEDEVEEEIIYNLTLKVNDIVLCVILEKSSEFVNSGEVKEPLSKREYDLTDAVVVGIIYEAG